MATTFVTAFLDLKEDRSNDKSVDTCFKHFHTLCPTIKIVVFLSKIFENRIKPSSNIHIIYTELEDLQVYKLLNPDVQLPKNRTAHHDTKNFMILMNSKIDFVKRAIDLNVFSTKQFAWIDFSINHVFHKKESTNEYLRLIGESRFKAGVYFPGCWSKEQSSALYEAVHWRFCGGFFLGDSASLIHFYNLFFINFPLILENNILLWEVNNWKILEEKFGWNPIWYKADHNDTIIRVPTKYLEVVVSLTTIPSRIEKTCRLAIDSLLHQVDHIYLSVPSFYKRFSKSIVIPDYFNEEPYNKKVSVVISEDKGPATKYLGALEKITQNTHIFFCDDDQEYNENIVSRILQCVTSLSVYQNRYSTIQNQTSGGLIHGYVGNLVNSILLKDLPEFPLPDCAYHVDDQWMSIYYFKKNIQIFSTGIESYNEIYKTLENNHEKVGEDSLAALGTRDDRVKQLADFFQVEFIEKGEIKTSI